MELREGKMKSRELADWFGISYDRYRRPHVKKRLLQELKNFADFDEIYGGVVIKRVIKGEYIKDMGSDDDMAYLEELQKTKNNLATISGIAESLQESKEEYRNLKESSVRRRMMKAGVRLFGITKEADSSGYMGDRNYIWAVKEDGVNQYRYLTVDEDALFDRLIQGLMVQDTEKVKQRALLDDAFFQEGSIMSKEEYIDRVRTMELDTFTAVLAAFAVATGHRLVRVTEHNIKHDLVN